MHAVAPAHPDPPHWPYFWTLPELAGVEAEVDVMPVVVIEVYIVVAAAEVTEDETVPDPDPPAPLGPETPVVMLPVSTYTPLKYQSSGPLSLLAVLMGRRSTPRCQSSPFCWNISRFMS